METSFQIITGPALSDMCDYSFGDHNGGMDPLNLPGGFMKEANERNTEFLDKCKEFEGKIMTLYIDNVRLYNRLIKANEGFDTQWIRYILDNNDLLALCAKLVDNRFIIFSHQEDTVIDENIKIPANVLGIYAVNAEYKTDKLYPFPFGVQRKIGSNDPRQEVLVENIKKDEYIKSTKLLYITCNPHRNPERTPLLGFVGSGYENWVTTHFDSLSRFYPYNLYQTYLDEIKDHKFVACPRGHDNCYDTHKIWETLYLRRVPVVKDYPYFRRLLQDFPVLYAEEWSDITEQMLEDNNYLYREAQEMPLKKLDLSLIYNAIVKSYD